MLPTCSMLLFLLLSQIPENLEKVFRIFLNGLGGLGKVQKGRPRGACFRNRYCKFKLFGRGEPVLDIGD